MIPETTIEEIVYPYTDGQPMGESRLQLMWIYYILTNIDLYYLDRKDVFVSANNFIYPVQGRADLTIAPDVYVAYGRPKQDDLKSYKLWEQGGIFPQVVIELLSQSNSVKDMLEKRIFCEKYGCDEYIEIDPYTETLAVWVRKGRRLRPVRIDQEWVSPLMGVRFVPTSSKLSIHRPDGKMFRSYKEIQASEAAQDQALDREAERAKAEAERADAERQRADATELENAQLLEKLRNMGIDPNTL